mgnify:FL=1
MKVNETVSNVVIQKKVSQPEPLVGGAGGADGPGGASAARGDGPRKLFMNKLMEAIHAEPEVRTEVVEKYKDQIKSGEYKMNPEELASRIIKESIEESYNS